MVNLIEELNVLANKHNKKIDIQTIEFLNELANDIYKFAEEIKNDPDSVFNNINDEAEETLLCNQENYLKIIKILNNVHNDKESIECINFNILLYNVIKVIFLKVGFSKGLSHFYSLTITKDLFAAIASEMTSEFTVEDLSSYSDFEINTLKLKNKLTFSLIELTTNKKFTSTRTDKFIESIELSKEIKSLGIEPAANKSNSNFTDTTKNENKFETLKSNLYDNGFFEITKVKSLSYDGQSKLIDLLVLNDTPYIIAMFDFLGYFKYLTNERGLANSKIHSKVGAWLNTSPQTIKCNMLVLNEKSALRENNRYTAHLHKEKVNTDYYLLK